MYSSFGRDSGNGLNRTPSRRLKIAVLAPMPSANVRIAATVNPGDRRNDHIACRMSCHIASTIWRKSRMVKRYANRRRRQRPISSTDFARSRMRSTNVSVAGRANAGCEQRRGNRAQARNAGS
jgi:hypothetical protein